MNVEVNEPLVAVRVVIATRRNSRGRNEDAVGIAGWVVHSETADPLAVSLPLGAGRPALIAVTDGMGGAPAGEIAAQIAAEALTRPVPVRAEPAPDTAARFAVADAAVLDAGTGPRQGMACTAAMVAVFADGSMVVSNTGDVRVYQIVDSYAGQLSQDHRCAPGSSAVERCLGGTHRGTTADPFVSVVQIRPGDRLILCTDGVHDRLSTRAIEQAALSVEPVAVAVALMDAVEAAGGADNSTVVVVDVPGRQRSVEAHGEAHGEAPAAAVPAPDEVGQRRGRFWSREKRPQAAVPCCEP